MDRYLFSYYEERNSSAEVSLVGEAPGAVREGEGICC